MMYGVLIPGENLPLRILAASERFPALLRALSARVNPPVFDAAADKQASAAPLAATPVPALLEAAPYCRLRIVQYWRLPTAGLPPDTRAVRSTVPASRGACRFWRLSASEAADIRH